MLQAVGLKYCRKSGMCHASDKNQFHFLITLQLPFFQVDETTTTILHHGKTLLFDKKKYGTKPLIVSQIVYLLRKLLFGFAVFSN